jgi:Rad3-related DNA helicase
MLTSFSDDEEESVMEISNQANKVEGLAASLEAILGQMMEDAVYWMDIADRTPRKVTLNAAPINVAAGLKMHLFDKVNSVVLTSATLCASSGNGRPARIF